MNKLILLAVIAFSFKLSYSQSDTVDYSKYEIVNHPYYNGKPLERSLAVFGVRVKGLGYGGVDTEFTVKGDHSKISIPHSDSVSFIIKSNMGHYMPMSIYRMKVRRGNRVGVQSHNSTFFGADNPGNITLIRVINLKGDLHKLTPEEHLPEGEYSIMYNSLASGVSKEAFSFNIPYDPLSYLYRDNIRSSYKKERRRLRELLNRGYVSRQKYKEWSELLKESYNKFK